MHNDTNTPQQAKAKRIIQKALSLGFLVSVADGDGGWLVAAIEAVADALAADNPRFDRAKFLNAAGVNA